MSIATDFAARFPEIPEATQSTYLPGVLLAWPSYYGLAYAADTQEAVLQLCAHLLTVDSQAVAAPLQQEASKSVGSVSVSYAVGSGPGVPAFFASTKYGQRFWLLARTRAGGSFV